MKAEDGIFFFQAEDGIRDVVRSRGLGDVYKKQIQDTHNYCDSNLVRHLKTDPV